MANRRDVLLGIASVALSTPAIAAAGKAQTVLGSLDAARLGVTLPHEHIADTSSYLDKWPNGDRASLVAASVEKLKRVRAAGIGTIVDLTTYDVGRDIRFLEAVSRQSGLHMIAATGQRFFPPQEAGVTMPARDIAGLSAFFEAEIRQGIDGTAIKAGVIKIGVGGGRATALEETGLRAAVRASKATGAPIRIHAHAIDRAGENLTPILENEGIDPARVSFDHSDDSGEMDYFLGLVKRGYSLGMDHVHRGLRPEFKPAFETRADCIRQLVDAGFAGKIFLSQDVEFGGALIPADKRGWRDTIDPPEGLLFITRTLIPHLEQIGVPPRVIHTMTVENPRRFFSMI